MIKSKTALEVKTDERTYEFVCSPDAPLGEVFDALSKMRSYVVDLIKKQRDEEKPSASAKQGKKCQK